MGTLTSFCFFSLQGLRCRTKPHCEYSTQHCVMVVFQYFVPQPLSLRHTSFILRSDTDRLIYQSCTTAGSLRFQFGDRAYPSCQSRMESVFLVISGSFITISFPLAVMKAGSRCRKLTAQRQRSHTERKCKRNCCHRDDRGCCSNGFSLELHRV